MLESLLSGASSTVAETVSMSNAFAYCIMAGILGLIISITYIKTGKVSKNFSRTLIILPILVCVVMLVVNGNLGTSVAIVGAFGLIRFRSLQGSSRDIAYIFFVMAAGLTCSVGYIGFAIAVTLMVCAILFILQFCHYGEDRTEKKELRITIPENLDYAGIFDDLFEKYTVSHKLNRVRTTNMGSLYELNYDIALTDEKAEKEFIDAIRCRNGNLTVICGRKNYEQMEEL